MRQFCSAVRIGSSSSTIRMRAFVFIGSGLSVCLALQRQLEDKTAPLAELAEDSNGAAVHLGNMFYDGKAEPDALRFPAELGANPIKALEDSLVLRGRNARAVIFHRKSDQARLELESRDH